jgi:cytochrome c biogenesis protein CcmG, thiol:disulfide interchange protein DsbE
VVKKRVVIFSIFASCVIIGALLFSFNQRFQSNVKRGEGPLTAPAFELADFDGKRHQLEELRGNLIILHFWASWCAPCLEEIPHWVELGTVFENRPVKLVAVSLDQRKEDALKVFPNKNLKPNVISLYDPSGKVPDQYGSFQFPETYLINSELKIITKLVGPQDWSHPELRRVIERLIPKNAI